jgi:hypothetical protein
MIQEEATMTIRLTIAVLIASLTLASPGMRTPLLAAPAIPTPLPTGTATLRPVGGTDVVGAAQLKGFPTSNRTLVELRVTRLPASSVHAWRLNGGSCSSLGAIVLSPGPYKDLHANSQGVAFTTALLPSAMILGGQYAITVYATRATPADGIISCGDVVLTGEALAPNQGGTIRGAGGTSVDVPAGAIPYPVEISVAPVAPSEVVAPTGPLPLAGAIRVGYATDAPGGLTAPTEPLTLRVPAPPGTPPGALFIVGQQMVLDQIGPAPGLRPRLVAVDTAIAVDGQLVSQATVLPGVYGGGLFAFVAATGSGYATGIAADAAGPRPGVVISNDTNTLVSLTDGAGRYTLFISGGPFTVTGFDPLRGTTGSKSGAIPSHLAAVSADIALSAPAAPIVTRPGIRNGGFERADLSSWSPPVGDAKVIRQLGPTSTGKVIAPTEGSWMLDLVTSFSSAGETGTGLKQQIRIPAGARTLHLDYNFVSEEFPEFVGSPFDDTFRAIITSADGKTTVITEVSVNQHGGFELIGDCGFPDGDTTCGQTGWRTATVDVARHAGTEVNLELIFTANDLGDDIFDTHVLVDNIRFATVQVDAKIISGTAADEARVRGDLLRANEILSQAGLNLRLRAVRTIADPGALLDVDLTWKTAPCSGGADRGILTEEAKQLMAKDRGVPATDLNLYYVRKSTATGVDPKNGQPLDGANKPGMAIGPDDYCMGAGSILTGSGIILTELSNQEPTRAGILARLVGRILISPQSSDEEEMAVANDSSNFMHSPLPPTAQTVNPMQSANINRPNAPLLVP